MYKKIFRLLAVLCLVWLCGCAQSRQVAHTENGAECRVSVAAVGDIALSRDMIKGCRSDNGFDFTTAFNSIAGEITSADLSICNLEGNFCGAPYNAEEHNDPEALAAALKATGFDIVQTANTYSIHNGLSGLESTLFYLQQAGLEPVGTYLSESENKVCIREINGIRIGMIAFTKGVNNVRLPEGAQYCVNLLYSDYDSNYAKVDTEAIQKRVEQARENVDILIALVHWGSEYDRSISKTMDEIEDTLLYNGVDVILGTHSHFVQPIMQKTVKDYRGKKKNAFIAYSLGDFFTEPEYNSSRESMILKLELSKFDSGITEVTDFSYTPIYINNEQPAVLHVSNSIELYENQYYNRVSDELYEKLLTVADNLKKRINPES